MRPAVDEAQGQGETVRGASWMAERAGTALHRILGAALLAVVAVNVANATGRYLFGFSVTGTDELMVYTMAWVVMAGAILSLARRDHISVNLLPSYATGRWRHLLHVIHDAAAVFACAYATYASYLFVIKISRIGTSSMGLGIPMIIPHTSLLAGFAALTVAAVILLIRDCDALARLAAQRKAAA